MENSWNTFDFCGGRNEKENEKSQLILVKKKKKLWGQKIN